MTMRRRWLVGFAVLFIVGHAYAAADVWSLDFDASKKQYVRDTVTGFDLANRSVSIALWCKFKSAETMAFCGTDVYNNDLWLYYHNTNQYFNFTRGTGSASGGVNSATWTPTLNEWYFIAVTHDQSTVRFYVGTTELSTASLTTGFRISGAGYFNVGAVYAEWASDKTWLPFDGQIAGLVIVSGDASNPNYVLSSSDLATMYNSGTIDTSSWSTLSRIKRLYTMEEGTGTTTSNGYNGGTATLSGVTGYPTWTALSTALYASDPSPADGATGQNRTVKLSWTDDAAAVSHDLWGGTDPDSLSQLQTASTQTWYVLTGLVPGVPYYWRVDEIDSGNNKTTGEVWSFTPTGKIGARP